MRSGIARQALRRHRGALLGTACTQALAACVISTMIMVSMSLPRSPLSSDIVEVTEVFIGISIYLSILMVAVTMNLATVQQIRDIALLRAVGASPGQIRRSVAVQAAVVAVPSTIIGCLTAIPAGALWVAALKDHGAIPDGVQFSPHLVAVPIALGIEVATSVVGALIASARTARIAPTSALTEAAIGRRPIGRVRIAIGAALVVGGAVLSAVIAEVAPDSAFFVMLAECVGVGLLGPVILRRVVRLVPTRAAGGIVRVALDDIATMSRSLSGALVPLVLAAAFSLVKVGIQTTTQRATGGSAPAAELWTEYSGTAIYAAFAAIAALNCLVLVVRGRRRDLAAMQLAGGTRRALVTASSIEALVVTVTALVLATGIAVVTLAPILHSSVGRWLPYIPVPVLAGGVLLVAAVVAAGMVAPAARFTRRQPIEVVASGP